MNKYILKINGMRCSMCESHINDSIRKRIDAKKIKSSHSKNETIVITDADLTYPFDVVPTMLEKKKEGLGNNENCFSDF